MTPELLLERPLSTLVTIDPAEHVRVVVLRCGRAVGDPRRPIFGESMLRGPCLDTLPGKADFHLCHIATLRMLAPDMIVPERGGSRVNILRPRRDYITEIHALIGRVSLADRYRLASAATSKDHTQHAERT